MPTRLSLLTILLFICSCSEVKKPEEALRQFIENANNEKSLYNLITSRSGLAVRGYLQTRKYAEKLNPKSISCEITEEKAECKCKTSSGKKRNFVLIKSKEGWKVDLSRPEIILEIFHLLFNNAKIDEAIKYATPTEKDRLAIFKQLVSEMAYDEKKNAVVPFKIKCKKYNKKYECTCTSSEGEINYLIFRTSIGWKAELGGSTFFNTDSIIDYNSSGDFNLNQHDLDSLTDFSQKMLDSMLNL